MPGIVKAKTIVELKQRVNSTSAVNPNCLKKLGMVVNSSKNEIVVFDKSTKLTEGLFSND